MLWDPLLCCCQKGREPPIIQRQPPQEKMDPERFDRQVHAIGASAMDRLINGTFLFVGLSPVGVETARNIVLGGCKCILLCDDAQISADDVASNFLLNKLDLGMARGAVLAPRINALNPRVHVLCVGEPALEDVLLRSASPPDVVVASNIGCAGSKTAHLDSMLTQWRQRLSSAERLQAPRFIAVRCLNLVGAFCSDFGEAFVVEDPLGHQQGDAPAGLVLGVSCTSSQGCSRGSGSCWDVTMDALSNRALIDVLSSGFHDLLLFSSDVIVGRFRVVSTTMGAAAAAGGTPSGSGGGDGAPLVVSCRVVAQYHDDLSKWDASSPLHDATQALFAKSCSISITLGFDCVPTGPWAMSGRLRSGLIGGASADDGVALGLLDACHASNGCSTETVLRIALADFQQRYSSTQRAASHQPVDGENACDDDAMGLIDAFSRCPLRTFYPVVAVVGGIVAQEAIKAVTRHLIPETGMWCFDCRWLLTKSTPPIVSGLPPSVSESFENGGAAFGRSAFDAPPDGSVLPEDAPADVLALLFGNRVSSRLHSARLFLVGAGAIGCEYLRALSVLGIGSGKQGRVDVTDPDHIEISNLSRQTLFSDDDVAKSKSAVAVAKAKHRCRQLKARSFARQVNAETASSTGVFGPDFFRTVDVICGAVDNDDARLLLDELCGRYAIPMVDSGTLGVQGHVVAVIPHVTMRLSGGGGGAAAGGGGDGATAAIPFCTLHFFPTNMLHCVQWATDCFAALFAKPAAVPPLSRRPELGREECATEASLRLDQDALHTQLRGLATKAQRSRLLQELHEAIRFGIAWVEDPAQAVVTEMRRIFEHLFVHSTRQLLVDQPLLLDVDAENGRGGTPNLFWNARDRRMPPLEHPFDASNENHRRFVTSGVALLLQRHAANDAAAARLLEDVSSRIDALLRTAQCSLPEFVPLARRNHDASNGVRGSEDRTVGGDAANNRASGNPPEMGSENAHLLALDNNEMRLVHELSASLDRLIALAASHNPTASSSGFGCRCIGFDKDDASGVHVAFAAAAANIRASIYRIPQTTTMDVKRIAGRIVPALITTTSVVTNFAVLQLIGLLLATAQPPSVGAALDGGALSPVAAAPEPSHANGMLGMRMVQCDRIRDVNVSLQCLANSFLMECSRRTCLWTNPLTGRVVTPWTRWEVPLKAGDDDATIHEVLSKILQRSVSSCCS